MSTDPSLADGAGHRPAPFRPDLLAGSAFIVFGLAFAIGGSRYDVGSALRMGSGYVPLALGGILVVLGLLVLVMAFRGGDPAIRDVVREPDPVASRRPAGRRRSCSSGSSSPASASARRCS